MSTGYNVDPRAVRGLLPVLAISMHLGQQLHLRELWADQLCIEQLWLGTHRYMHTNETLVNISVTLNDFTYFAYMGGNLERTVPD